MSEISQLDSDIDDAKALIMSAVGKALSTIERKYGITPTDVHIVMSDITAMSDHKRRRLATSVTLEFRL